MAGRSRAARLPCATHRQQRHGATVAPEGARSALQASPQGVESGHRKDLANIPEPVRIVCWATTAGLQIESRLTAGRMKFRRICDRRWGWTVTTDLAVGGTRRLVTCLPTQSGVTNHRLLDPDKRFFFEAEAVWTVYLVSIPH
jgi:hypothetical protein